MVDVTYVCEQCEAGFTRPLRSGQKPRFCSRCASARASVSSKKYKEANAQALREQGRRYAAARRASTAPPQHPVRPCAACQELFSPRRPTQLYCTSSCRAAASDARRFGQSLEVVLARRKAKRAAVPVQDGCARCGQPVPVSLNGRPRRFCSRGCAVVWHNLASNSESARVRYRDHRHRRRAQKMEHAGITPNEWAVILSAFDHRCAYCGTPGDDLTMDHVVPLSRGGAHAPENIAPACRSCNASKGAKLLEEWRPDITLEALCPA